MPSTIVLKLIGYALAAMIGIGGLYWAYNAVQNYFIGIDNLRVTLSNEVARANRAEVSLGALEQTVALREAHTKELVRVRAESQAEIDSIRESAEKSKEVLRDRDKLSRVASGNSVAVTRLTNKATDKVFNELECIINDTCP